MAAERQTTEMINRGALGLLGALAGFAIWFLTDSYDGTRTALFLSAFAIGTFAVFFALTGPARRFHAAIAAVGLVLPVAALLVWASFRHHTVETFLDRPQPLLAFVAAVALGTPFVAAGLRARGGWADYRALFDTSWTIVVRYTVAWTFTGLFWALVFLSDALLGLVGIDAIEDFIEIDAVPYTLTGAVLGVALSVVHELRAYISPYLVIRLLRLLLPPVLIVVVVFLAALPFRGLSHLFGGLSAAGTLMAVNFAVLTLIAACIDRDDAAAVRAPFMQIATRIAALVAPLLGGLALAAVLIRTRQYGWTPDRVTAATGALMFLLYGAGYVGAVTWARGWAGSLRRVNLWMALAVIGVSAAWLTPLINAERLSVASQLARFEAGRTPLDRLPLWELTHEWGKAGEAGIARLAAMTDREDHEELIALIESARDADYAREWREAATAPERQGWRTALSETMPVRPDGAPLPAEAFAALPPFQLERWHAACRDALPDGRPGCVAVRAEFLPGLPGRQAIVLLRDPDRRSVRAHFLVFGAEGVSRLRGTYDLSADSWPALDRDDLARVLDGDFEIAPIGTQGLVIGDNTIIPDN